MQLLDRQTLELQLRQTLNFKCSKIECSTEGLIGALSDELERSMIWLYDETARREVGSFPFEGRVLQFKFGYVDPKLLALRFEDQIAVLDLRKPSSRLAAVSQLPKNPVTVEWSKHRNELFAAGLDRTIRTFSVDLQMLQTRTIFEPAALLRQLKDGPTPLLAASFYKNDSGISSWTLPELLTPAISYAGRPNEKILDFDFDSSDRLLIILTSAGP